MELIDDIIGFNKVRRTPIQKKQNEIQTKANEANKASEVNKSKAESRSAPKPNVDNENIIKLESKTKI
jgi:hypothetical protein